MSISLDQDRNTSNSNESLFLSDILSSNEKDVFEFVNDRNRMKLLFTELYSRLSEFEKEVFILYCKRYSYEEIAYFINKTYHNSDEFILVKSIDNGLSRIKKKAKEVYKNFF